MVQVYRPLEFLFTIAAFTTLAENFLPQLIALPKVWQTSAEHDQAVLKFMAVNNLLDISNPCACLVSQLLRSTLLLLLKSVCRCST